MLDALYLQLEDCMNSHIDNLKDSKPVYQQDDNDYEDYDRYDDEYDNNKYYFEDEKLLEDDICFYDEELKVLLDIINQEVEELLVREKFTNINQSSRQYHTNNIYGSLTLTLQTLCLDAYRENKDFDLNEFKAILSDKLDVFLPDCHLPQDFPYKLKEALLDEMKNNGEIERLLRVIEKHYSMKLQPYLAKRKISDSSTYKKGGSNYEHYLSIVNANVINGLKEKALKYYTLTEDQQKIFQSNGRIINYIKMTIEHNGFPKTDNKGMYKDYYQVFSRDVDIDSLKKDNEEGTVDKEIAGIVIAMSEQYKAMQARLEIIDILRYILNLNNKPHHTLTFLDMTCINKGFGVERKESEKAKDRIAEMTLEKYHDKIFYVIKEFVEDNLNDDLMKNMNVTLEENDYDLISYKLAHEKPKGKTNVIGTYTMEELSPTVSNITKWNSRVKQAVAKRKENMNG